jgi:hypothetical protein
MPLPNCFCWTRFGTEAGQSVGQILARKEEERTANAGVFFWGIGNAIGPSMLELLRQTDSPEAVFSPIRSAPRREDAAPSCVVAWTEAQTLSGDEYRLPKYSLITSRFDPLRTRAKHYALVCYRKEPITTEPLLDKVQISDLRNLLTSRPVGASQVTAVVHLNETASCGESSSYNVAFKAQLTPPYFILLREPVPLTPSEKCHSWTEIVCQTWDNRKGHGSRLSRASDPHSSSPPIETKT